jgi:hypothetical protein
VAEGTPPQAAVDRPLVRRPAGQPHRARRLPALATDWEHYAQQMLEVLSAERLLANLHPGYAPAPASPLAARPTTKFHARGERLGHGVWDLVFARR